MQPEECPSGKLSCEERHIGMTTKNVQFSGADPGGGGGEGSRGQDPPSFWETLKLHKNVKTGTF